MAMKTVCILARSHRLSHTRKDYLLYQDVIEAVRAEMSSTETLSLQTSVMVFYAILALAIQAGSMAGLCAPNPVPCLSGSEAAVHLNAAGYMLGVIHQFQTCGGKEALTRLVSLLDVVHYLLALSKSSSNGTPAWPLLMYHLIVQ